MPTRDGWGGEAVEASAAVARERGADLAAVALAWVRAWPGVVAPVVNARTRERRGALLTSVDVTLSSDETDRLAAVGG
ncbi:aldo/keto reductase [Actinoalloteichus hoggarensis]|uniref:aldo/keto reductase n=1 Tax=Actinoalloteichus hoggarensis TaxID=1470176 RepID=UPI0035DE0CC5